MQKVLITGGSGFLAARVGQYLSEDPSYQVFMPRHSEMDITSLDSCKRYFEQVRPNAVIHLAAISDITKCAQNEDRSRMVNTMGPINMAYCAKANGISGRFLYASSDQVYTANYTDTYINKETDSLSPDNLYGVEKVEAEEKVQALISDAIALRMVWMFDLQPGKMNYLKNMIMSVKEQVPQQFAVNELRAQTYAIEIAENMKKLLESSAPGGAYNFGGPCIGSSYETALKTLDVLGEYMQQPVKGLAFPVKNETPRSLALDQSKLNSIGLSFKDTSESARYCLQMEGDRIPEIHRSETYAFF